jgi:hypothetical protein
MLSDKSERQILILGFGRMGVSHALQICGILGARNVAYHVTVVDPSRIARLAAFSIYGGLLSFKKLDDLWHAPDGYYDYAIDATPPSQRFENVRLLEKISKRYLVEKPVVARLGPNGMSGYVLQHNPLINHLASVIATYDLEAIEISLNSNLRFDDGIGWRAGINGGVINEFLGHLLSVPLACCQGLTGLSVDRVFRREGAVETLFKSPLCPLRLTLEYGDASVRKSTYKWRFVSRDSSVTDYDCYQILTKSQGSKKSLGLADLGASVEFYLRGFDFCAQALALLEGTGDKMDHTQLALIDSLIQQVLEAA